MIEIAAGNENLRASETKKNRGGAPRGKRAYDPAKHCGAQRTNQPKGVLCTRGKGQGTSHPGAGFCDRHLGDSPSHKAAAEKAALNARKEAARQACDLLGLDQSVEKDPAVVILLEVERAQKARDHWETQLALKAAAGEQITQDTPELALWMIERKTVVEVSAKAQALGIMLRRVEIEEDTARVFMGVLMNFARLAGLDPDAPAVRRAGREALQLVAGGAV